MDPEDYVPYAVHILYIYVPMTPSRAVLLMLTLLLMLLLVLKPVFGI